MLFRLRFRGTQDEVFVRWQISPRSLARGARPATVPPPPKQAKQAKQAAPPEHLTRSSRPAWRAASTVMAMDAGPPSSKHLLMPPVRAEGITSRRLPGATSPLEAARAARGAEGARGDAERLSLGRMRAQARRKGEGARKSRRDWGRRAGRERMSDPGAARGGEIEGEKAPSLGRISVGSVIARDSVRPRPSVVLDAAEAKRFAQGVLAVSCLAAFMSSLNITALFVAFSNIGKSFPGASVADLSWVLNAYTIVFSALLVPAGRVADRLGHKRSFLLGLGAFCAASALSGASLSVPMLVVARVLQAFGAALYMPASLALVLGAHAPERRTSALGVWSAVSALASAFGPALGSVIVQNLGWRWVFFLNVPLGAYVLYRGRRALVEVDRDESSRLPDPVSAALLVAALSALALWAVKGPEWGWTSGRLAVALGAAAAATAVFIARSRRVAVPVFDLALFADRTFSIANFTTFVFNVGFTAAFFGNVIFLTKVWGYSLQQAGLAVTPGPLAVVPVAIVGGRLADRYGCRPVLFAGGLVTAAGGAWLMRATDLPPNFLGSWLPGMVLTGIGVGLVLPVTGGAATANLPPDRLALGGAINQAVRQFGTVFGIAMMAALLAAMPGATLGGAAFAKAYAGLIAAGLIATLCGVALPRTVSARKPESTAAEHEEDHDDHGDHDDHHDHGDHGDHGDHNDHGDHDDHDEDEAAT